MSDQVEKDPETIREMFGSIAGKYDLLNRVLSLHIDQLWRKRLVKYVREGRILDLACGTGDVLNSLNGAGHSQLFGTDFSFPMLAGADKKSVPGVRVQGDALALPFADDSFRTIACAFGVRNFVNRRQAFSESHRILQPGGKLLILEFFPPGDQWYLWPYRFYLKQILPRIGRFVSGRDDAYHYLRDSVEGFTSKQEFCRELNNEGFDEIKFEDQTGGISTIVIAEAR